MLRIRTLAALMWAVFSVAGVPGAHAGINAWTKVGLPGGNVVTLAIDPTMPDTLYGGGDRGVFKSTDGGSTWSVNAGLTYPIGIRFSGTYPSVTALAVDPATPGSLFAGAIGGGVFKSTDGGNTWNATNSWFVSPFIGVSALVIDPSTPGTLYAGFFAYYEVCLLCEGRVEAMPAGAGGPDFPALGDGVFKSTDGGNTWNAASTGLDFGYSVYALAIDPATPSILYAGTETGVFKSTDGGGTWDAILPGYVAALAIDPISPGTLYAGTPSGVFKSTDGGGTWDITGWTAPVDALVIDPGAPATLYAATASCGSDGCLNKVFKSTDGGGTWSATGLNEPYERTPLADTPLSAIKVVLAIGPTTPATLYAGTISGVFKSTDGASAWRRTTSGTNDWVSALAVDPTTPNALYAGTRDSDLDGDGAGVSKSMDGGATWGAASTGLPSGITSESPAFAINALAIDRTTPGIVYAGTNDGVFKSMDAGGTWSATGLTEL